MRGRVGSLALGILPLIRAAALQAPIFAPDIGGFPAKERLWEADEDRLTSTNNKNGWSKLSPFGGEHEPGFPISDPHVVPIRTYENMEYFASITLGTPAQPFHAMIDISWSDLFVPSIACKDRRKGVCKNHLVYHPTWSRTYVPTDTELHRQDYVGLFYDATVSRDVLSIAGIEITDQAFHEATYVYTDPSLFWLDDMDGVLGLAPDSSMSPAGVNGPLTNMFSRGLLDRNIVSIMLGRRVWDEELTNGRLINGELMFGGINEALLQPNTTMTFLSMSNKTDPPDTGYPPARRFCNGTWQVPARAVSITWLNETSGENQTERVELAETWTARLDTTLMFVTVPPSIEAILRGIADPFQAPFFYPFIDCRDRVRLPNLVYTLGAGDEAHDFEITPNEYAIESGELGVFRQCLWMISRGFNGYDDNEVLELGSAFMRSFYVALDGDNKKIGFGTPAARR